MKQNITDLLRGNPYPGRGIIIGGGSAGKCSILMYFIMGRSENSRNRIFEKTDDGIRTAAFDESKMTDPSLIIYRPVRALGAYTIITNGDHTDTIWNHLTKGDNFYTALHTCEFEPDAPNYTPRISALVDYSGGYTISIIKTVEGDPDNCQRSFYEYSKITPGLGHFISTYETDGDPLPSFTGEPIPINICSIDEFEDFTDEIWDALDADNKVSLYTRARDIKTGEIREIIKNKNE